MLSLINCIATGETGSEAKTKLYMTMTASSTDRAVTVTAAAAADNDNDDDDIAMITTTTTTKNDNNNAATCRTNCFPIPMLVLSKLIDSEFATSKEMCKLLLLTSN